jgi:hypothetical protein
MPNEIFRQRLISMIKGALGQFVEAANINHPGLRGRIREIAARSILEPLLPEDFKVSISGKIVDYLGNQSPEVDLIVYSKKILPAIMYGNTDLVFPAESVFYAIEIKSKITMTEIESAHLNAKLILENIKYSSGIHDSADSPISHVITPIIPALFGFSSDLEFSTIRNDLTRYTEYLAKHNDIPSLRTICIVDKGYWWLGKDNNWMYLGPTDDHDEVIDFVSGVINTLHKSYSTRGYPRLGNYLMKAR